MSELIPIIACAREVEIVPDPVHQLVEKVICTLGSAESRKTYRIWLTKFVKSGAPLTRDGVREYLVKVRDEGYSVSSRRQSISAIRKLVEEADIEGLISGDEVRGIMLLKVPKGEGLRAGKWLTIPQVKLLLDAPDTEKGWRGKRDKALLSVLVGTGLRRAEVAALEWEQVGEIEGRKCLVNLRGKGNKLRTVPLPKWADVALQEWHCCALQGQGVIPGKLMVVSGRTRTLTRQRALEVRSAQKLAGETVRRNVVEDWNSQFVFGGLTPIGVWDVVKRRAREAGLGEIRPHDLRRTLAQLMRRAEVDLEEIQMTLGHSSIATTQIYLGSKLEMREGLAGVDQVPIAGDPGPKAQSEDPEPGTGGGK